jgi:hypothetical protein
MLNFPFDTPALFQVSKKLVIDPGAIILMLIQTKISAINQTGKLCTIASAYLHVNFFR